MMRNQITLSELQRQAAQIATKIQADRKPVLITQRGCAEMVLLDVKTFREFEDALRRLEALELRQLVEEGRRAYAEGRLTSHAQVADEVTRHRLKKQRRAPSKRRWC